MDKNGDDQALSPRLGEAFAYAARLHAGQVRKKTQVPVISHLMAVTALVLENGGDETEAIAALLHDGPEDRGGQPILDDIRSRFGERVAAIVAGCSDTLESPKPAWRPRKQRYLAHLPEASESTLLVSLADKVHNVRSLVTEFQRVGDELWNRFSASREESLWYYHSLLEIFRQHTPAKGVFLVRQLESALAELDQLLAAGHRDSS